MELQSMFDLSHVFEMRGVGNMQALHTVCMTPLLEMLFKRSSTPIACAATNLALKFLAQTVQLVKPVRYRFTVPAHRQILRVVFQPIFFIWVTSARHCRLSKDLSRCHGSSFSFKFLKRAWLLLSNLIHRLLPQVGHQSFQPQNPSFWSRNLHQLLNLSSGEFWRSFLCILRFRLGRVYRLYMSLPFLVKMEHALIQECFVAKTTVKLVLGDWVRHCLSHNSRNKSLPPEQRPLLPFRLKHLLCLINYSLKIHQWLCSLEEILQVITKLCYIAIVLAALLDVQRDQSKFV